MNQILQFFIGNAWLLIPIVIGLFNVAVRVKQKAAEQKARRDALAEIQRRKTEAMRTGKQVNEPIIVYDKPEQQASGKTPAQERQERIEALRKQRMDQLRAMREKRAGGAGTSTPPRPAQSQQQRTTQSQRTSPLQQQVRRPAQARPAQTRPTPASPTPTNRPRVIPATQPQRTQPRSSPTGTSSQIPPTRVQPPSTKPVSAIAASTLHDLRQGRPNKGGFKAADPSTPLTNARDMLRNRNQVRQAIVLREVLNAPVAMREPESGPGNLPS